jgi:hypothetical protein
MIRYPLRLICRLRGHKWRFTSVMFVKCLRCHKEGVFTGWQGGGDVADASLWWGGKKPVQNDGSEA